MKKFQFPGEWLSDQTLEFCLIIKHLPKKFTYFQFHTYFSVEF